MRHVLRLPLSLLAWGMLAAAPLVQAQVQARRTVGPLRDAGTYHVASGTWTRGRTSSPSTLGPDAIYRNDAPSGYFGTGWEGCWTVTGIMLPGPTNPYGGSQDAYSVDGMSFSYCKLGSGTIDWTFGYYDSYVPCDDPTDPAHGIHAFPRVDTVVGLPGGSACWTVTLDLGGGYEVCLAADGGEVHPRYQGGGQGLDHGGIGFAWTTTDGATAGPVFAGDPTWKPRGEGTCYLPNFTSCSTDATGLGTWEEFSISGANGFTSCALSQGCYFFSGYNAGSTCGRPTKSPPANFDIVLYSDCAATCVPRPCATIGCDEAVDPRNVADIGIETCWTASASIEVRLASAPAQQFAMLLVGDGAQHVVDPPGADGTLCLGGGACLGRYAKDVVLTDAAGAAGVDLKGAASAPCNGAVTLAPGATWRFQFWHRQPGGAPSGFSSALEAHFQ